MTVHGIGGHTIGLSASQRQVKLQAQAKTQQKLLAAANKDGKGDGGESEGLTSKIGAAGKAGKAGSGIDLNG